MSAPILYCGDTTLETDAAYLAAMLTIAGFDFDHTASDCSIDPALVLGRRLVILSDYPAARMNQAAQFGLVSAIETGTNLLMIGGWESFHGLGGNWDQTLIANVLPVVIESVDDRLNCDHPVLMRPITAHPAVEGLPWTERVPGVGGFNRCQARPGASVVLQGDRVQPHYQAGNWSLSLIETHPMLVFGQHGRGRTAVFASDAAPHWVGGFVDWGDQRVAGQAIGSKIVEVGNLYATFWRQLLTFMTGQR